MGRGVRLTVLEQRVSRQENAFVGSQGGYCAAARLKPTKIACGVVKQQYPGMLGAKLG